jgi:hypothetical protein
MVGPEFPPAIFDLNSSFSAVLSSSKMKADRPLKRRGVLVGLWMKR